MGNKVLNRMIGNENIKNKKHYEKKDHQTIKSFDKL